jgi:hypothetical protein
VPLVLTRLGFIAVIPIAGLLSLGEMSGCVGLVMAAGGFVGFMGGKPWLPAWRRDHDPVWTGAYGTFLATPPALVFCGILTVFG